MINELIFKIIPTPILAKIPRLALFKKGRDYRSSRFQLQTHDRASYGIGSQRLGKFPVSPKNAHRLDDRFIFVGQRFSQSATGLPMMK
jgi:hypothetical protein